MSVDCVFSRLFTGALTFLIFLRYCVVSPITLAARLFCFSLDGDDLGGWSKLLERGNENDTKRRLHTVVTANYGGSSEYFGRLICLLF